MIKETIEKEMYENMREYFLRNFSAIGERKQFRKGEIIDRGLYDGCCKFIVRGMLKISVLSKDGDQKLFLLMRSGEMYDEYPCYGIGELEMQAVEDMEVVFFTLKDIYEKTADPAKSMEYLLYSLNRKKSILMMQSSSFYFDDSIGRIASFIIRTACQCGSYDGGNGKCQLDYCFTHEEIAGFVGCSRVTVTRHLKELTKAGIIDIVNRHIVIKDMEALTEFTNIP